LEIKGFRHNCTHYSEPFNDYFTTTIKQTELPCLICGFSCNQPGVPLLFTRMLVFHHKTRQRLFQTIIFHPSFISSAINPLLESYQLTLLSLEGNGFRPGFTTITHFTSFTRP